SLGRLDLDRVPCECEPRGLGLFCPGAELAALEFRGRDQARGPLALEYRFTAPGLARPAAPRTLSLAPIMPSLLVRRYVTMPVRSTALALGYQAPFGLDVALPLPASAAW